MTANDIKNFWLSLAKNARHMHDNYMMQKGELTTKALNDLETNLTVYPNRPYEQWIEFSKSKFAEDCIMYLMPTHKHSAYERLSSTYRIIIKL